MLTEKEILELRPTFKFAGITMTDWFDINKGEKFFSIRSGLKHADGETRSPYHFDYKAVGDNSQNEALEKFTLWWLTMEE